MPGGLGRHQANPVHGASSLFFVRLELPADNGRTSCVCRVSMSSPWPLNLEVSFPVRESHILRAGRFLDDELNPDSWEKVSPMKRV